MAETLEVQRWDAEYRAGKYDNQPPVPFVNDIMRELGEEGKTQFGLYVGCGDGRNYIPLVESGLRLSGIDISQEALEKLIAKYPAAEGKVFKSEFLDRKAARVFDYLIAIQVFQHGSKARTTDYFKNASDMLKPDGKLFLRVNSVATKIHHKHHITETDSNGGFTVVYDGGPKKGLSVHFYSEAELTALAEDTGFRLIGSMREVHESRRTKRAGSWAQWETIWQKT